MNETDTIQRIHKQLMESSTCIMDGVAKSIGVSIESDKIVSQICSHTPSMSIINAPIAGLTNLNLEQLLNGCSSVMFVYLSQLQLANGDKIPAGFYLIKLVSDVEVAELVDIEGKKVSEVPLEVIAVPSRENTALSKKRVSTNIEGPNCTFSRQSSCRVCLTLDIDGPGPFDVKIKVCIDVIVETPIPL